MSKNLYYKNYPYSRGQLTFFAKEIKEAGGFDELMIRKQALEAREDSSFILTFDNIEEYKEKYLSGVYETLCPFFNTKVPYSFWSQLYIAIKRKKELRKLL